MANRNVGNAIGHNIVKKADGFKFNMERDKRIAQEQFRERTTVEVLRGKTPDRNKKSVSLCLDRRGKSALDASKFFFPLNLTLDNLVFAVSPETPRFYFDMPAFKYILNSTKTAISYDDGWFEKKGHTYALRRIYVAMHEPFSLASKRTNDNTPYVLGKISVLTSMSNPYFVGVQFGACVGGDGYSGEAVLLRVCCKDNMGNSAKCVVPELLHLSKNKKETVNVYFSLMPNSVEDAVVRELPELDNANAPQVVKHVFDMLKVSTYNTSNEDNVYKLATELFPKGVGKSPLDSDEFFKSRPARQLSPREYASAEHLTLGDFFDREYE